MVPPGSPVEALRRNLLYRMFKTITEEDMGEIVGKQIEKAKGGDDRAARLIIDMVKAEESPVIQIQQNNSLPPRFLSDMRRLIVEVLAAIGRLPPQEIAARTHVPLPSVLEALDHDWFERKEGEWYITEKAQKEVLQVEGPKGEG